MKTTTAGRKNGIQWTLWTQLDDLDFADDLALLSHSHTQMQDKTTCLEATSAGTGLKINRKKTELMKINTTANTPVTVGGEPIREVESFVYLGSVVDGQGGTDRDVTARIGKARAAMVMLKNVWASKVVSIRTKLRIFNSNVKSVLLYGCETWRTTKTMQQKIQTFLNTCLRRIFNIRWPEKIRNEELWERAGQEPVAKQILRRKWGWIGHTLRKPASSTTRQALTWNPQGKRKRGRPRNSWRRDTEAELCKQGTNWTGVARLAQNRARLQWAQGHLNWNNVRWQNVLFSDESRFCIDHADGRVRVWRRRDDRYADNCVVENNAWGGPSLMLWGAIGHNQVLGPVIFQGLGPGHNQAHGNWVFQHDNARPHTARATQDLLQRSGTQKSTLPEKPNEVESL
nr:hypothetical protein BaRGS_016169 [Batillaria attramentaria]